MPDLTLILIVILLVRWVLTSIRLKRIEDRLAGLGAPDTHSESFRKLTVRVYQLEQAIQDLRPAPPETAAAPEPEPVPPVPIMVEAPLPEPAEAAAFVQPEPVPVPRRRAEDWETLVGGNLLNKLGALVLVIGIGLFLSYSFAHMTPAGRTLLALTVSAVLLLAGVFVERREKYRIFARGLIAAGWAGLYASAYAMYALEAARIIDNAFLGSLLLLVVAGGMIGHSLAYRVQGVTGLAYFTAFAALAATPATPFAVVALIPLAASLLYLAYRFEWYSMAVFGALATYATCISRGSSDAPLLLTESLFAAYWLLFEAFDILRAHRRARSSGVAWIFPLNTSGFLGLSYAAWSTKSPGDEWQMAAIGSALYLASALVRARLVKPAASETPDERLPAGGFEAPLTIAAALAGLAIAGRVEGLWMGVGLAIEAET
ncbi:MAG: DUF2339 domain-containing protein, partial [Acidobacteriia bacterium]|nr:DUF2339 domain-containing protein [Terriglobia bacterium]